MTLAHKFEIGSDDDNLTVEQVAALPTVKINLNKMTPLSDFDPEDEYYAAIVPFFDVYFPDEQINADHFHDDEFVYFVKR